ncbi:hypothetical protein PSP6_210178 [Paraburkholderia tropica]|nr:hypothetical protein PSP6_210178 [Paraburkholderia tropica]
MRKRGAASLWKSDGKDISMQIAPWAIGLKDSDCCDRWATMDIAMKTCVGDKVVDDLRYEAV